MLNPAESTSSPNASASSGRSWPGSRAIGSTSAVLAKCSAAVSAGRCRASGGRRVVLTEPPAVQQSNQGREGAEGVLGVLCVLGGSWRSPRLRAATERRGRWRARRRGGRGEEVAGPGCVPGGAERSPPGSTFVLIVVPAGVLAAHPAQQPAGRGQLQPANAEQAGASHHI